MYSEIDYSINDCKDTQLKNPGNPEVNYGQILEHVVRRDRMGISEIARKLNVSRRTLYNWFEMKNLNFNIICRIGVIIGHDFSKEFPEEFEKRKIYSKDDHIIESDGNFMPRLQDPIYYWMDRYIKLLENFNSVLSNNKTKYTNE